MIHNLCERILFHVDTKFFQNEIILHHTLTRPEKVFQTNWTSLHAWGDTQQAAISVNQQFICI